METTQMAINEWIDEHSVFYPTNGILYRHKNEWIIDTCYNMFILWKNYAKWLQSITRTDMIQFHSYEDPKREIYKDRKYISGCLGLRIRVGSWEAWVR